MSAVVEPPHHLVARTEPIPEEQDLLGRLPETRPLAWLRRGEGLVGWGVAARLALPGEPGAGHARPGAQRFSAARHWLATILARTRVEDTVGLPGCGPVVFASLTFDPASPGSVLVLPRVVIGRRFGRSWLTVISEEGVEPPCTETRLTPHRPVGPLRWSEGALGARRWGEAVAEAVRRIRRGDLDKVVLARDLHARGSADIDTRTVLDRLLRGYPDCYTFSVAGMVGATPELLFRRGLDDTGDPDSVSSLVLAGTRPRGATVEEDEKLAAELVGSVKDVEEHRYAVDSLRDTLAPLCSTITVPEEPELLRVPNVQHLASPVRATLLPGTSTLAVIAAMHPTAAVGGTPTPDAVALIRELEGMDRGRYAGPVGWIDSQGRGEWGIALRSAEIHGRHARLFAGGGIVAGSDPAAEIAEADSKFRVMREALGD